MTKGLIAFAVVLLSFVLGWCLAEAWGWAFGISAVAGFIVAEIAGLKSKDKGNNNQK